MVIIYESEHFQLKSFGAGTAYSLESKSTPAGALWHGDDAARFLADMIDWETANPGEPLDRFMAERLSERSGVLVGPSREMIDLEEPPADWESCEICGGAHPPGFDGDCRDDKNRWPKNTSS